MEGMTAKPNAGARFLRAVPAMPRSVGRCLHAGAVWACVAMLLVCGVPARASTALEDKIESIVSAGKLAKAQVGVHVVALGSGRIIYARNANRKFIVASNQKLITAATALETLGEDYEFRTVVSARGSVAKGELTHDLVLRGGGDPSIGGQYDEESASTIFRRWAGVLKARGLRRVRGDVVGDDTFFDGVSRHPEWSSYPAWKWYYTPVSALSVNDNCVTIKVEPAAGSSGPARLSISPGSAPVRVRNVCKTSGSRHAIWFDREPYSDVIKVGGYVRRGTNGYTHDVSVPNPCSYAAFVFKRALEDEGISVDGRARTATRREGEPPRAGMPLCERRAALVPILRTMVKRSHNHYAEQVIKTVGAEASGTGSWEAGLAQAARMLNRIGASSEEFELDDGSGLSRRNRVPPALLTALLLHMAGSEHDSTYRSLLAVAGQDGTLSRRLTEEPYAGNVLAKTGYLDGVGALSGYATTRSGVWVAFSILINDTENPPGTYSMRTALDSVCRAIVDLAE